MVLILARVFPLFTQMLLCSRPSMSTVRPFVSGVEDRQH